MVVILSVLLKSGENFNLTGSNFGSPNSQHSLKGKLQALEVLRLLRHNSGESPKISTSIRKR
jgi:hypothetical protein